MIQDIFPHKLDNVYKNKTVTDNDYIVIFDIRCTIVEKLSDKDYKFPKYSQIKNLINAENLRYLFSVDDNAYYLYTAENTDLRSIIAVCTAYYLYTAENTQSVQDKFEILPLADVRKMKYDYFKEMYFLICTAWHIYSWYIDNRFCGKCGEKLSHDKDERVLICPKCGNHIYPRISPAVIVGVTNGDKIIMSKYAGRPYKGYALLSGFVEVGETLEQTVEREVAEEVGVRVKNIRYYKSQPGGVDGNILAGFFCELDGDDTLKVDTNELAFAKWFKRDEIPVEDDGFSLTFEMIGKFKRTTSAESLLKCSDEESESVGKIYEYCLNEKV